MTSLAGRAPKDTFKDLLQISNSNAGIDATLRTISDGEGTSGPWQISTVAFRILGGVTMDLASGAILDIKAGTFKADAIAESTGAAGVTVDGVLLKDGGATLTAALSGTTITMTGRASVAGLDLNAGNPTILGNNTGGITTLSANTTALGFNWRLYGDTEATNANDLIGRANTTVQIHYDDSASLWDFQTNAVVTAGNLTVSTNVFHVDVATGRMGAGTITPLVAVHVITGGASGDAAAIGGDVGVVAQRTTGATSSAAMNIISGNTGNASLYFGDTDDSDVGRIVYSHTDEEMKIFTNALERMSINSVGEIFLNLPAVGTGTSGSLWNDSGTVKVIA